MAFTERSGHASALARAALLDGFEQIVAVGGDGTINEVVNGLLDPESGQALREGAVLGVIPMGTGGDFRRSLNLEDNDVKKSSHGMDKEELILLQNQIKEKREYHHADQTHPNLRANIKVKKMICKIQS